MAYNPSPFWDAVRGPCESGSLQALLDKTTEQRLKDQRDAYQGSFDVSYPCSTEYGRWIGTPLLRTVKYGCLEDMKLLLDAGARPDGVDIDALAEHAAVASRRAPDKPDVTPFIPDDDGKLMQMGDVSDEQIYRWLLDPSETEQINEQEITQRGTTGSVTPFWRGSRSLHADLIWYDELPERLRYEGNIPVTSITLAAGIGLTAVIDLLLSSGSDASYWQSDDALRSPSPGPTHSVLSTNTPLHAAIYLNHPDMISHLLKHGFSPNVTPYASSSDAISPLAAAILWHDRCPPALNILSSSSRANFGTRTPHLNISLLHFAVATMDHSLMDFIQTKIGFGAAGDTALGHSLLHIACLPLCAADITGDKQKANVLESIHDCLELPRDPHEPGNLRLRRQESTVGLLRKWGQATSEHWRAQDVYGNTPLHYLAAPLEVYRQFIRELLQDEGMAEAWRKIKNHKGYTASDLYGEKGSMAT